MGLRLATYNVAWFNALFDDGGRLLADNQPSSRHKVTRAAQIAALGQVFRAIDACGIMVIEAPDTNGKRSSVRALERFAARFGLRATRAITGFASDTEQEISFLYDPLRLTPRHDPQASPDIPRFDGSYAYDRAAAHQIIRFSKPPLELTVTTAEGRTLHLIGVHAKSKAPHGARDAAQANRISIENRRKQLAQCLWLRARVDQHLTAGNALVVLGDFNDGPGIDSYEARFGKSGVEIVLGTDQPPQRRLFDPHARMALTSPIGLTPTTARFWLDPQKRYFEALLDFIMVSPDLAAQAPAWRIWHPFNDPACLADRALSDALLQASDHFPVTLDFADLQG
ncbi:MAG: endonuclease [Pseudomonadota bacterium]